MKIEPLHPSNLGWNRSILPHPPTKRTLGDWFAMQSTKEVQLMNGHVGSTSPTLESVDRIDELDGPTCKFRWHLFIALNCSLAEWTVKYELTGYIKFHLITNTTCKCMSVNCSTNHSLISSRAATSLFHWSHVVAMDASSVQAATNSRSPRTLAT